MQTLTIIVTWSLNPSQKGLNSYNIIFHLENDKMSDQLFTMRSFWETLSFLRFQQNVENPFLYF